MTPDGRLVIDDPEIRQRLIKAIDSYTAIYRKGCTPPDSVAWDKWYDNNKRFLDQAFVMTPNETLSAVNALKNDRPEDYYQNVATIEWPLGPTGKAFPIYGDVFVAVVFKDGGHVAAAKEFVRFLVGEGWLAHYLDFSGRAHSALDLEAARPAVLARPARPAPDGRGDADRVATDASQLRRELRATGATTWSRRRRSGRRRSTASPPTASAPSRRSTRRSPGSSRSWRNSGRLLAGLRLRRSRTRLGEARSLWLLVQSAPTCHDRANMIHWRKYDPCCRPRQNSTRTAGS